MELDEAKFEFEIRPGVAYRENRLIPVVGSPKVKGVYSFLSSVKRYTVRTEMLVCCLCLPDRSEGLFLDSSGREYLITKSELKQTLSFVNSKFQKRVIPKYLYHRGSKEQVDYQIAKFLSNRDTQRRYKGWMTKGGEILGIEPLSEATQVSDVADGVKLYTIKRRKKDEIDKGVNRELARQVSRSRK